jgi:GNS1/SUR4 family
MYTYYLLTTFKNTKLQKMTRFAKPFITALQITQLLALAIHCLYALSQHCSGSKLYALHFFNLSILIFNFARFYLNAYQQKKTKSG